MIGQHAPVGTAFNRIDTKTKNGEVVVSKPVQLKEEILVDLFFFQLWKRNMRLKKVVYCKRHSSKKGRGTGLK